MVDDGGRIRRTPGIGDPELRDLHFPPHSDPAVPDAVVQHAVHTVPEPGELPGSFRKGIEIMKPVDFPPAIGAAGKGAADAGFNLSGYASQEHDR
jgi:hypothetical protein